jgi:PAS domain S-box-containing protein
LLAPKDLLFDKNFSACREGVFVIDLDRLVLISNPAATTILGYSPDELVRCGLETLILPQDRLQTMAELAKITAGKLDHTLHQARFITKYGAPLWCWVDCNSVHYQGQVLNVLVHIWSPEDVRTENVLTAIQERLKELEIQLEHHPSGEKMTIHIGDSTQGDKVGRDKTHNSQRAIYWICGVLIAIVTMLTWAAYYFASSRHHQPPVGPPSIERPSDGQL